MKKNYLFAVALGAIMLASCSQDEQFDVAVENHSAFTGVVEGSTSRTTLGDDYSVNWEIDDQVSIFEMDDQNTQFKVKKVSGGVAHFEFVNYTSKTNPVALAANYAVYPYSETNSIDAQGTISTTIPAAIDYAGKDDAMAKFLMVAKSENANFGFTNAQGMLLLRLNAQKPTNYGAIKSIKIASAAHNLAGTATMSWTADVTKPEAKIGEGGTKELTLNLSTELQKALPASSTGEYAEYYIPVVPTAFEKGDATMTIEWVDESKEDYVMNIGIAFTVERSGLKPLKHTVGSKTVTGTTEGSEGTDVWDGTTKSEVTPVNGVYTITKASELAWIASNSPLTSNDGTAESVTIDLQKDIDMNDGTITAIIAQRGDALTFNGNGHTISNINIVSGTDDNTTGQASLFYCYPNSTLNVSDLILENMTVTADANGSGYAAALVGYCEGTAVLSSVTVTNATINGEKSSGMLAGHVSGSLTATNCSVNGTVTLFESTYEPDGHYAGEYIGTVAGSVTLTSCTEDVTVSGSLEDVNVGTFYGRIFSGSLVVDGSYAVGSATDLTTVVTNATESLNIILIKDVAGDATITQKAGVQVTIDGQNYSYKGVITVDGKSATYTTAGLTVKNLKFDAESISADACINLGKEGDNNTRYTCNVTVENCTFDVTDAVGIKSYTGGDKNLIITGCTATSKAHSLVQAKGIDGVTIKNCIVNSKNGMNFNNSDNVAIENCSADTQGYAARFGESSGGTGTAETYSIKDCTLKSANDGSDATIILRGTADNSTLTITNTTITGNPQITNNATNATVTIDGKLFVSDATDLSSAIQSGATNVCLAAGNYTMPATTGDVTISGTAETVITINKPTANNVTLSGVTVVGSGYATGIQHSNKVVYENCIVKGEQCLYANEVLFKNCAVDLTEKAGYIWTYGAKNVKFEVCQFNTLGKAILIYNEGAGASNVTVTGCTFNATEGAKAGAIANQNCAAIEIDNSQTNGTGAAHNLTTSGNTYNETYFSGEWRIKTCMSGNAITVNEAAYTSIALDGKTMTIDADKNVTFNE